MKARLTLSTAQRVFVLVLGGYVVFFFWLACRKLAAGTAQTGDAALLDWAYYSTLHGKFFWCFDLDNSYFESHQESLLLLYLPIYFLLPSLRTLYLLQTLSIAVASVPVFLLGLRVLRNEWAALFGAVAFLFFPTLVSQHVNQVHTSVFPLPFLMFALYFFHAEQFGWFVGMLLLACLGKEVTGLTGLMFVPYAVLKRRSWLWVIASAAIPASALYLALGILQPYFSHGKQYIHLVYFSKFGGSLGSLLTTVVTDPGKVFEALLTTGNLLFLVLLLSAGAVVVPFLALEVIFIAPELFLNLISENSGMRVVAWHYNVNVGAFLIVAAICALPRVARWFDSREPVRLIPVLAAVLAACSLGNWWQWFLKDEYHSPREAVRKEAMALIPPDDSCFVGPGQLMALLSHRPVWNTPHVIIKKPSQLTLYNWVFLDMNYPGPPPALAVPREMFYTIATNSLYEAVFARDNVFVFRRRERYPPEQVPLVRYWD